MTKQLLRYLSCLLLPLLCSACDVTRALPEGEQLYTGIKELSYNDVPKVDAKASHDTTGVISAVAHAAQSVQEALKGPKQNATRTVLSDPTLSPKEHRRQLRQQAAQTAKSVATVKEELNALLELPPNGSLFGSSKHRTPFPIGLWFYTGFHNSPNKFGKWLFKVFAKDPILISYVAPHTRAKVARNTLTNYGFFQGRVQYDILPQRNPRKAKVSYQVHLGPLWTYGPINHLHFPAAQDSILRRHAQETLLHPGQGFSVVDLDAERNRISHLFRENGYFFWRDNYTIFKADTTLAPQSVYLHTQPVDNLPERARRRWVIGNTYIKVMRNMDDLLGETHEHDHRTYFFSGRRLPVRRSIWNHTITHHYGNPYRLSQQRETIERLGATGIFRQLGVNYAPADSSATCDTLNLYVNAVLDNPFSTELESNVTFKSNQQMGPGLSYAINKKNAFRGGEKISFKIYGSYEWQLTSGTKSGSSALNSYELGSQLSLSFPRLFAPYFAHSTRYTQAETKFAADVDWKKRSGFFTIINSGLSATYSWKRTDGVRHEFKPLSIQYDNVIRKSHSFDSIMTANPALYISMRNQFIPSMSYTLTYASPDQRRNVTWFQASISEAGNLLSSFYRLRGKSYNKTDKTVFGSPYAQFLKTTAELHRHFPLGSHALLATRLYAGAIWSYGNSTRAPYSEQFYAGGANSIRGFTARTIGPGAYYTPNQRYAYLDRTGDVRLEANAELRAKLMGNIHGAVFLDAGNVWLMRKDKMRPDAEINAHTLRHIAVGTGAGLRYDIGMLVLRFDIGVALHAPYETSRSGFYNIPKFRDALNFHFAIGYPF